MRVLGATACSIVALILSSCGGSTSSSEGMLGEIPAYYEKQGLDFCAQVSEIGKASGYSQDQETVEKVVKLAMDLSEKSKEEISVYRSEDPELFGAVHWRLCGSRKSRTWYLQRN